MSQNGNNLSRKTRWEAYSDYRAVSSRMAESIDEAVDAYATVSSAMAENVSLGPEQAADCRRKIQAAAIRLLIEMEQEVEKNEDSPYTNILADWKGDDEGPGYLQRLQQLQLQDKVPGWMLEFIIQIRRAGWELGYLQAGRQDTEYEDETEGEAREMFENL